MRPARSIAAAIPKPSRSALPAVGAARPDGPLRRIRRRPLHAALTAGLVLLLAGVLTQPAQAAAPTSLSPDHQAPWLVLPGEQLTLPYVFNGWDGPLPQGTLYLGNDTRRGFTRLPMVKVPEGSGYGARALVARVPGSLVRGDQLRYYAALHDPATGQSATVPAGGAHDPQRAWVLHQPLAVALGSHRFGHLRPPDAIVARAGPGDVGFSAPPPGQDGLAIGPQSFDVARDGSVWLVDQVNRRLLAWQPGRPTRPTRSVRLPRDPLERVADVAVAADGTIYATYVPPPGPGPKTLRLCALTPTGQVRWTAPTINEIFNAELRVGPDGTLYVYQPGGGTWTPVTSPAGRPLPLAEQRRRASPQQPLTDRLRLTSTMVSGHEWRFALTSKAGHLVRAWRVTSQTDIGGLLGTPALVGGDPVVTLEASQQTKAKFLWEHLVVRLAPTGVTRQRFALDARAVWGDTAITGVRVAPDGQLYQLRTSRTTGVSVARYSVGPTQVSIDGPGGIGTPPPAPAPRGTAPRVTQPAAPAPTATLPAAKPTTRPASELASRWLIPGLGALATGGLAALCGWLLYRRRHPAGPRRPRRSRLAH
jgi:hypothetical protein